MQCPPLNLMFTVITTCILSTGPIGFEVVVLNSPETLLEAFVNASFHREYGYYLSAGEMSAIWGFIISCQSIGALIGCFLAVPLAEIFGRRFTLMLISNVVLIGGSLLMGLSSVAEVWELLVLGRLLLGISAGMVFTVLPMFLSEISPSQYRGASSCLQHTSLCLGTALGALLSKHDIMGNEFTWAYLLGLPSVAGVIQILLCPLFPESPKFLHLIKREEDKAMNSVRFYHGHYVNVGWVLEDFEKEVRENQTVQIGFRRAFAQPIYRRSILLGALVNFAQVFTGLMSIVSYSTEILKQLGFGQTSAENLTAIGSLLFAVVSLPALYLVEKVGRRPLLLWTLAATAVANVGFFVFGLVMQYNTNAKWAAILFVIAIVVFSIAYNLGPGPIAYFISGELAAPPIRTVSLAVGVAANWLSTIVSVFAFSLINTTGGAYSFLLFVIPSFLSLFVLYWKFPETKSGIKSEDGYEPILNSETSHQSSTSSTYGAI